MKTHSIISILYIVLFALICSACSSLEARNEAHLGRDALKSCQFDDAYDHFSNAHDLLSSNEEILLGLGISELALVFTSDEFNALLPRFGTSKTLVALCNEAQNEDETQSEDTPSSCETISFSKYRSAFPDDTTQFFDNIDPTLTWQDCIDVLITYAPLLQDAATHLLRAAQKIDDHYDLGDVFSFKDLSINKADIALLSATAALLSGVSRILSHYDNRFSLKDTLEAFDLENYDALSALFTPYLLTPSQNASDASDALPALESAINALGILAEKGYELREDYDNNGPQLDDDGCEKHTQLLRWETVPYGIYNDFKKLHNALKDDHTLVLDRLLDPSATLSLPALLTQLPTRPAQSIILTVQDDELVWSLQTIATQLNSAFTPPIFDEASGNLHLAYDYSYRLNSAWLKFKIQNLIP